MAKKKTGKKATPKKTAPLNQKQKQKAADDAAMALELHRAMKAPGFEELRVYDLAGRNTVPFPEMTPVEVAMVAARLGSPPFLNEQGFLTRSAEDSCKAAVQLLHHASFQIELGKRTYDNWKAFVETNEGNKRWREALAKVAGIEDEARELPTYPFPVSLTAVRKFAGLTGGSRTDAIDNALKRLSERWQELKDRLDKNGVSEDVFLHLVTQIPGLRDRLDSLRKGG